MSEKGPLQIIADLLPQGPDEWVSDRLDVAHNILIALDQAGYVILARRPLEKSVEWPTRSLKNVFDQ